MGMPFLHYVDWLGDEGMWLHTATRLLRGEGLRLPSAFLSLSPGATVVVAGWMGIFGDSLTACRILALLTLSGIAAAACASCLYAGQSRWLAACCALGWAVVAHGPWSVVSHHWFGGALAMGAVWAALASLARSSVRQLVVAGFLAGASAVFVPHVGAAAVVVSLVAALVSRRAWLATALAAAIVPTATLVLVLATGVLSIRSLPTAVAAAQTFAAMQGLPFAVDVDVRTRPLAALFPATLALLVAVACMRRTAALEDRPLPVLVAAAVGGFAACFPRADIAHISFAAPMALPLFAWTIGQVLIARRAIRSRALQRLLTVGGAVVALGLMVPAAWAAARLAWQVGRIPLVQLARGSVAFGEATSPGDLTRLLQRVASIPATDRFFFYPYAPMLPYLLDRTHVAPVDLLHPGLTSPEQYLATARAVVTHAEWIVIDTVWIDPDWLKACFPELADPQPAEKVSFEDSIRRGFELVQSFGRYQLWRRNQPPEA